MQYTIRQVPKKIDKALRAKAKLEKKSLNQVALEALAQGAGVSTQKPKRDLSDLIGTMTEEDARTIEETVAWMDETDLKLQRETSK